MGSSRGQLWGVKMGRDFGLQMYTEIYCGSLVSDTGRSGRRRRIGVVVVVVDAGGGGHVVALVVVILPSRWW